MSVILYVRTSSGRSFSGDWGSLRARARELGHIVLEEVVENQHVPRPVLPKLKASLRRWSPKIGSALGVVVWNLAVLLPAGDARPLMEILRFGAVYTVAAEPDGFGAFRLDSLAGRLLAQTASAVTEARRELAAARVVQGGGSWSRPLDLVELKKLWLEGASIVRISRNLKVPRSTLRRRVGKMLAAGALPDREKHNRGK